MTYYKHSLVINKLLCRKTYRSLLSPVNPACLLGLFGQECSKNCIVMNADSNNVTALCYYGFVLGWIGYFCNQGIVQDVYMSKGVLFKEVNISIKSYMTYMVIFKEIKQFYFNKLDAWIFHYHSLTPIRLDRTYTDLVTF